MNNMQEVAKIMSLMERMDKPMHYMDALVNEASFGDRLKQMFGGNKNTGNKEQNTYNQDTDEEYDGFAKTLKQGYNYSTKINPNQLSGVVLDGQQNPVDGTEFTLCVKRGKYYVKNGQKIRLACFNYHKSHRKNPFEYVERPVNGWSRVRENGKWNLWNQDENRLISPNHWFDMVGCYSTLGAYVVDNDKYNTIDFNTGKLLYPQWLSKAQYDQEYLKQLNQSQQNKQQNAQQNVQPQGQQNTQQ